MKKLIGVFILFMLLVSLPVFATPMTLTDVTLFDEYGTTPTEDYISHGNYAVNQIDYTLDYVYWIHHFDFPSPVSEIYSGTLELVLRDIGNAYDLADSGDWIMMTGEFPIIEFANGGADWIIGEMDDGNFSHDVSTVDMECGMFGVLIKETFKGTWAIDSSTLTIEYEPAPIHTPEPITLLWFLPILSG